MTVNNFFWHWLKEVDKKRYGDSLQILPIGNSCKIYQYSDAMQYDFYQWLGKKIFTEFLWDF